MKRKLFVASLLALLVILVCSSAMAVCGYTWYEDGVKHSCTKDVCEAVWHWNFLFDQNPNGLYCIQGKHHLDRSGDGLFDYDQVLIKTTTHQWTIDNYTAPTCVSKGEHHQYCGRCSWGHIKPLAIDPTNHVNTTTVTVEATCTTKGYVEVKCADCGEQISYEEKPALGHTGNMSLKVSPSCLTDGWGVVSCTTCKEVLDEHRVIPKLGHLPETSWKTKTEQPYSCVAGKEITYCPRCNTTMSSKTLAATTGHNYGDWKWSYLASDTSVLTHVKTCSICGDKKEERCQGSYSMANNGLHDHVFRCSTCGNPAFHNGVGGKATCTSGPICTKCGLTYGEPLGHRNLYTETVKEATCTENGKKVTYCGVCKAEVSSTTLVAPGHKLKDASYPSTCTTTGWTGSKCTVCGFTEPGVHHQLLPHDFTKHTNVKPATCTTNGSYDLVCSVCGTYATTNPILANGHTEGAQQTTKAATCCAAGTAEVRCTVCKTLIRTVTLPATNAHSYEWRETKAATCTTDGVKTQFCANSGKNLGKTQTIPANGHTEGAQQTTKAATCCEAGTAEVRCTVCKTLIRTVTLPATNAHSYEWRETKAATCTTDGVKTQFCANSGKNLGKTQTIPAKGHTEGAQQTTKAATCCEAGTAEVRCTVCKALIRTVTLPATENHSYEWRVVREATCTEQGKRDLYCANSGKYMGDYEYIPAKGHTEGEPVVVEQPTCCETGLTETRCTVCNELLKTETIPAKGHPDVEGQDIEWRVTKEPTCTEEGVESKFCLNTGDNLGETRPIPAKGHDFGEWMPEPGDDNMKYRVCQNCGYAEYEYVKIPDEDCKHENIVTLPGFAPSCEENGYTEHDFCKDCGAPVTLPTVIPATGHQHLAVIPAIPATPEQPGKTEGLYCADCGKVLSHPQDVDYEGNPTNLIVNGLVVNPETGNQIGEVKDNVYTDNNGNVIGTFQPDGTLVDPNGNVIGDLEGNRIYDNNGAHVGTIVDSLDDVEDDDSYTDVDGIVINPTTGEQIGEVKDNVYTDNNGNVIGTFQPDGTLVDPNGNVIGDLDGNLIYDNDGNHVGTIVDGIGAEDFIDVDGTVVDPETGKEIGKVEDNVYTDNNGNEVGTFQPDGTLVDPEGNVIGKLEGDYIYDNDGNHVGTIIDGTLIPGHPDFDLGDYLDDYYTHVEDGEKIRPTIDENQCVIGSNQDVNGENTLISGAEDYAICPNDNYPLSQWIPTGDGNHVRVCTCATCDYSETAACVYFEITVNGDLYKICPICGHFGDEQYKHIRNVKVGVDGHLHELICRAYEAPFGAEAATVKDYADEAVVIADSFTACKSVKGELMAWGDAETLYIPMPNPGEVTLVRMNMDGEFENVPFMYFDGRIAFNAEDHGLYLIIAK